MTAAGLWPSDTNTTLNLGWGDDMTLATMSYALWVLTFSLNLHPYDSLSLRLPCHFPWRERGYLTTHVLDYRLDLPALVSGACY